jgi:hypothetical protein
MRVASVAAARPVLTSRRAPMSPLGSAVGVPPPHRKALAGPRHLDVTSGQAGRRVHLPERERVERLNLSGQRDDRERAAG